MTQARRAWCFNCIAEKSVGPRDVLCPTCGVRLRELGEGVVARLSQAMQLALPSGEVRAGRPPCGGQSV